MTAQQLVGLAVRLFAVWLGLSSITYFTAISQALSASPGDNGAAHSTALAIGGAYVAGAVLLWFFPMLVAHKLLPRTQHTDRLAFQGHELARVGCSLLGLWLLAKALPSLAWFLLRTVIVTKGGSSSFTALTPEDRLDLAVACVECVFALVAIFKSGAFASLVVPGLKPVPAILLPDSESPDA